ncbi:MAG: transposase [Candidatus Thermoplasmatota archaeon]
MGRSKTTFGTPEPEVVALDMKELEEIVERARSGKLSEEDYKKLRDTIETLAWMQQELANKNVTLARLRSLFGLNTSEKTKDVLGEGPVATPTGDCSGSKKKRKGKGHGRKGAKDYEGAERVQVEHGSLRAGNRCPVCAANKRGKLSAQKPRTLVRVIGQAPLKATVWELERLRCNLCGKVFVAEPPPGVGDKKYDAQAASMIGLLKYGSGLPFNRLERLEWNLGIPLPAATQWEIVSEAAAELAPVHEELIRQAAQGRLLHNDDTSMQVLDLRKEIDELERAGATDRTYPSELMLTPLLGCSGAIGDAGRHEEQEHGGSMAAVGGGAGGERAGGAGVRGGSGGVALVAVQVA